MPGFKQWDVVKLPFPYTDRATQQRRPALVVSMIDFEGVQGLLWVVMITSAENRGWAGDVDVSDVAAAGLPFPSRVRTAKIATVEAKEAIKIGELADADRKTVKTILQVQFGLA